MRFKINSMHQILAIISCTFITLVSYGQIDPPKLIQPSPSSSAFFKYQDYPVDYSTGLTQVNIPLYEVKSGSLSVPISLSYHAAGRKVTDQDGPVALGWSLNAGGMISRDIHGSADFGLYKFPYPFKTVGVNNYDDLTYLQKIMRYQDQSFCGTLFPYLDSEYDVFTYSFGGNSGKFIFKDNNNAKIPVWLPLKPFQITPITTGGPPGLAFEIIDDKGIYYMFEPSEFAQLDENAPTAFNLKKIISADKSDTITFFYTGAVETRKTISQTIKFTDVWVYQGSYNDPPQPNPISSENTSQVNYQISRISEIQFKQGKVKFNLVSGTTRMDNIQVFNIKNELLKSIKFNTSSLYYQSELGFTTDKLDRIDFKDKVDAIIEKYGFDYYPIDISLVNGPVNIRYRDWWGYYNNSTAHDLIPEYGVPNSPWHIEPWIIGNPVTDRKPKLEPMKSGVLKRVTYPTGGNSEFIYELNKCKATNGDGSIIDGPGLRIAAIKSTDGNGVINTRSFKYGESESGFGVLEMLPNYYTNNYEIMTYQFAGSSFNPIVGFNDSYYRERYLYSEPYSELSELVQRPVMYKEVTEYKGTTSFNSGKSIYKYDYTPWAASGWFPKYHISQFNYWSMPSLINQEDYVRVNSTYKLVRSTSSIYTTTVTEDIPGLHVIRAFNTPQTGYGLGFPPGSSTQQSLCSEQYAAYVIHSSYQNSKIPVYSAQEYKIRAGYKNLTNTTETIYTDAGNSTISTSYTYNIKNLLSTTTTISSKGESVLTSIYYPFNSLTGSAIMTQMSTPEVNMVNFPVEQVETKAGFPIKSIRTNYLNWGTTPARIAPETVEQSIAGAAYETRLRFYGYDTDGNPLSVSKEKDQQISYVWGYSGSYPIAEVTNAPSKNMFHTSFEDATGNSSLNDSKTGRLSKTGGFSKTMGTLDNGTYVLTYWQKSGSVWTFQSSIITVSTGAYIISLSGQVDEVRFYPTSSQMKTYTYDALVGTTSECSEADQIVYYEYDNYNRLKLIRDMSGNILKTFKYQLQSPTAY